MEEAARPSRGYGGREERKKKAAAGAVGSRPSSTAAKLRQDPTTSWRGDGHWAATACREEEKTMKKKIECLDTRARNRQNLF